MAKRYIVWAWVPQQKTPINNQAISAFAFDDLEKARANIKIWMANSGHASYTLELAEVMESWVPPNNAHVREVYPKMTPDEETTK